MFPFTFYSSIYDKMYIMMTYIFSTVRLYSLPNEMQIELHEIENALTDLSEKYI